MVGVSEVAAVAAGTPIGGRTERRGNGPRACQPPSPAGGYSRSLEPADEPPAIATRYLSARRSRNHRRNSASQIHGNPVRPAYRLRRPAPAARAGDGASDQANGLVAQRGESLAGAPSRNGRGLEPPRRIPHQLRR